MEQTYNLYALKCPIEKRIKYIGVTTKTLKHRLYYHLIEDANKEKLQWINELKSKGLTPQIKLLETITATKKEAFARESELIALYTKRGYCLLNHYCQSLAGKTFDKWTVLKDLGTRETSKYITRSGKTELMTTRYYLCRCICGNEKQVSAGNLITGKSTRCSNCRGKEKSLNEFQDWFSDDAIQNYSKDIKEYNKAFR